MEEVKEKIKKLDEENQNLRTQQDDMLQMTN